jgi:hypothetical protein
LLGALAFETAGCRKAEPKFECETMGGQILREPSKDEPRQCFDVKEGACERLKMTCFEQQRAHCFRYHSNGRFVFRCYPTAPECEKDFRVMKADLGNNTAENCRFVSPKDIE